MGSATLKVTFLILAHTDPKQLKRLVSVVGMQGPVFVHIDAKANLVEFEEELSGVNGVKIIDSRLNISWGGFSMVEATLALCREALVGSSGPHYMVLLSGQDYPLRPVSELKEYLEKSYPTEFISYIDMRESPDHYMKSVERLWFWDLASNFLGATSRRMLRAILHRVCRIFPREYPHNLIPYFGSQWWCLTADCVGYITQFASENSRLLRFWKYTMAPDEHFIHTVVGNSHFAHRAIGLLPFRGRGTYRLANLHHIDPTLKKIYSLGDWSLLKDSNKFFIRKVSTSESSNLLNYIDRSRLKMETGGE